MARTLILSLLLLSTGIVAGCGPASTPTRASAPEKRLADVLTTQHDAEAAYHLGNFDTAATLYQHLTRLIPQEANYWYLLGNTYVRLQQPDLAVQAYQQAILRDPKHARAWHNLGIVRMRQAEAAFVSSASTATVADPMHEVSSHLADALATIGKGDDGSEKPLAAAAPPSAVAALPAVQDAPPTSPGPAPANDAPAPIGSALPAGAGGGNQP